MTAQPPVDFAALPVFVEKDLHEACMHDADLTVDIVNTALEDIPLNFQRLEQGLQDGRLDDACRAAHSIKSVSRQVGGLQLAEIMAVQERGLHRGQRPAPELGQQAAMAWQSLELALRGVLP